MKLLERAVINAKTYIGLEEVPNNGGWEDKTFERYMKMVGFELGWAYCSLFAELCWSKDTYEDKALLYPVIKDCCSANAVRTYENFKNDKSGLFKVTDIPAPGAIVIWEKRIEGKPDKTGIWTKGHAGIVTSYDASSFKSIEANTNKAGSREGKYILEKERKYTFGGMTGLFLKGFIVPVNR